MRSIKINVALFTLVVILLTGRVFAGEPVVVVGTYMLNNIILRQANGILEIGLGDDMSLITSGYYAGERGNYNRTAGIATGLRMYSRKSKNKRLVVENIGVKKRLVQTGVVDIKDRFQGSFVEIKYGYSYTDFDSTYTYTSRYSGKSYTSGSRYTELLPGVEFAYGNAWRFNDVLSSEWLVGVTSYLNESEAGHSYFPLFDFALRVAL